MKTYTTYFDASFTPELSRCAFYIEQNNIIIYKEMKEFHQTICKSHEAEIIALLNLFNYITNSIEPMSNIKIYGDARNIIDVINNGVNPKYAELIKIFQDLQKQYVLEIVFIPRKENKKADKLTRNIPISVRREKTFSKSMKINLNDIVVSERFKNSVPDEDKYQDRLNYFINTGCFKKPIKICEKMFLFDGYISYCILRNLGIETYDTDVYCVKEYAV